MEYAALMNAVEQFVIELARGTRGKNYLRGLPPDAADDVLAHAVLLAWERRTEFDPAMQTLPRWFDKLVLEAQRALRAPKPHENYAELLADLSGAEDTERAAQLQQAVERLTSAFGEDARQVLKLRAEGMSIAAIAAEMKFDKAVVRAICTRGRKLGAEWLPDAPVSKRAPRQPTSSDDDDSRPAPIDIEIERLLQRPKSERADCPICWRCTWYYGLRGGGHETEVDKRKDDVAASVSAGTIGFTGAWR